MREVRIRDVALSLALVAFAVLSPLISLLWATKIPLDYAVGYALGSLIERMPATALLRVFLEVPKGAEGLTFYVRVYHLRLEGADRVGEVSVVPEQVPQDGIKFQLRVQKVFEGYTEVKVGGRWVRRPLYKY